MTPREEHHEALPSRCSPAFRWHDLPGPPDSLQQRLAQHPRERSDERPVEAKLAAGGCAEVFDARLGREVARDVVVGADPEIPGDLDAAFLGEREEGCAVGNPAQAAVRPPEPPGEAEDELADRKLGELREAEPLELLRKGPGAAAEGAAAIAPQRQKRLRERRACEVLSEKRLPDARGRRADANLMVREALAGRKDELEGGRSQEASSA